MQLTAPRYAPDARGAPARPPRSLLQRLHRFLTSPKLAIALLVAVLACCVVGVTVLRGERAWRLIFTTLWFNALLVLLAVSSAAAFFTRIWRRKLTLVSAGMIVFHVSFAAMLGGIVYDSLFFFHGVLRLTEGETLRNADPDSYDTIERGRFFALGRLKGETTLLRMHTGYRVNGDDKRAAYDVLVKDGGRRVEDTIYVTRHLDFDGVRYFPSKEGYSVLVVMYAKDGRELYGGHVPLQSIRQPDGGYFYTTGTATGPGTLAFPAEPAHPVCDLQVAYRPSASRERDGDVTFMVSSQAVHGAAATQRAGRVAVGAPFAAGEYTFVPREIRYWVGMSVRYDPGLIWILTSLCLGLAGIVLTFVARVRQGAARSRAAHVG